MSNTVSYVTNEEIDKFFKEFMKNPMHRIVMKRLSEI